VIDLCVQRMASARLPLDEGNFQLCLYRNNRDGLDHLAFVLGDVAGRTEVLTRLHSECFTGDVAGSLRCDCGPQFQAALKAIGAAGRGVLVYLRQEGRGIGLLEKLRAYNLQDEGFDTVDANLQLGHAADAREYSTAALILKDLGIQSLDLITNNPRKIEGLQQLGITVHQRVPLHVDISHESLGYMHTKVKRMEHMLTLEGANGVTVRPVQPALDGLEDWLEQRSLPADRPLVTLAYAQSLDGSIAIEPGRPLLLSGPEAQLLTHRLRRWHDGISVGIGTVLSDDPRLTVRLVPGESPRPIILDSHLRFPLQARLLNNQREPWIVTGLQADPIRGQALKERGAGWLQIQLGPDGRLDLRCLLHRLHQEGIRRLMVEGGSTILSAFLRERLADLAVVTIAPRWLGGLASVTPQQKERLPLPRLVRPVWKAVGEDMVVWAEIDGSEP